LHFHFDAFGKSSARIPRALNPIESFISRWATSGAAERANYQMFLSELLPFSLHL
jgi:hypothetical protein